MLHCTQISVAPWKKTFEDHLIKTGGTSAEFTIASVTASGLPSARMCMYRGFWGTLPKNKHNQLPKNPDIYESDCPVFVTDARMSKVYDVFATGKAKGDLAQSRSGSGGGGPIEAVFWFKDTKVQWRMRGKCWIMAADDIEGEDDRQNSEAITVRSEVSRFMRIREGSHYTERNKDWSWRQEIENIFENLSPMMRGSFKNPPPRQPLLQGKDEQSGEALGQTAGHLSEENLARKNFRVAIIAPEQVEALHLSDAAKPTRQIWTLAEEAGNPGGDQQRKSIGKWTKVDTWP
ncbi:hypothetical protein LTR84_005812 [Exophiala bonariae]|uniref:Pyridoxamine 5'-phosphate oxidase Alr4036 family FMN-binding domain-containing protein n=1 Tax=Exophiala bonariae TaxID=1690606 RepID=A0AAV9N3L5_9EURO|nr:hypothetical protein LTR84_005812 [Exophiala bonariae]